MSGRRPRRCASQEPSREAWLARRSGRDLRQLQRLHCSVDTAAPPSPLGCVHPSPPPGQARCHAYKPLVVPPSFRGAPPPPPHREAPPPPGLGSAGTSPVQSLSSGYLR